MSISSCWSSSSLINSSSSSLSFSSIFRGTRDIPPLSGFRLGRYDLGHWWRNRGQRCLVVIVPRCGTNQQILCHVTHLEKTVTSGKVRVECIIASYTFFHKTCLTTTHASYTSTTDRHNFIEQSIRGCGWQHSIMSWELILLRFLSSRPTLLEMRVLPVFSKQIHSIIFNINIL